jgi:pimeloyl-ACP methyl ester carboxylesterase
MTTTTKLDSVAVISRGRVRRRHRVLNGCWRPRSPGSRLMHLPDAGHMLPQEAARTVNAAVVAAVVAAAPTRPGE